MKQQWILTSYTRQALEPDVYSEKLAYSLHLALGKDKTNPIPLNDDSGVLFAHATTRGDGTLQAKSFKNPILFRGKHKYGLIVKQTEENGDTDLSSFGEVLIYETDNFVDYTKVGALKLSEHSDVVVLTCTYKKEADNYIIHWKNSEGDCFSSSITDLKSGHIIETKQEQSIDSVENEWKREDIELGNTIYIDEDVAVYLQRKLTAVYHVETSVPEYIEIVGEEQLQQVTAELKYSDGSIAYRKVDWNSESINWELEGSQTLSGRVKSSYFKFPIAINRADPNVIHYNDMYYYIATDDTTGGNLNFYVRAASTISALTDAEEHLILHHQMYSHINKFLWAPEFHLIEDRLYILFASSPHEFGQIRCHMMRLKENGNVLHAADWEEPTIVLRQNGEELFQEGITLDMTYLALNGQHYVMWAQRQLTPVDNGSWLYIASISSSMPWQLTSEPVLISQPEFGWANNQTYVDEGPYPILTEDTLFVTFSSALVNATYCVGLLSINRTANLLERKNWYKRPFPILTSRSMQGEFGPGHNSYVVDTDGTLLNVYHAKPHIQGPRSTGIRPVHFGFDGEPILKLTENQFVNEQHRSVLTKVVVKPQK